MQKFASLAEESGLVILSGSAAPGIPTDIYARLIRSASSMGKQVILDTSGELLKEGVKAAPSVVKPNRKELEYIIGRRLQDMNDIKDASSVLLSDGVGLVIVSLGDKGLLLAGKGRCLYARAVSYTHLDVYKRQVLSTLLSIITIPIVSLFM